MRLPLSIAAFLVPLMACSLVASFDDYDTSAPPRVLEPEGGPALFTLGGTVDGVDLSTDAVDADAMGADASAHRVALSLNGAPPVSLDNGAFTFADGLTSGSAYRIDIVAAPESETCAFAAGGTITASGLAVSGFVASANVDGVAVHCVSSASALASLSISDGALAPAFSPVIASYASTLRVPLVPDTGKMIAITATTLSPSASLTINGAPAKSGVAFPFLVLPRPTPNVASIAVTAKDGSVQRYSVDLTGTPNDYLKAEDTPDAGFNGAFGTSVALSADGNTLVVGAPGDEHGSVTVFTKTIAGWAQTARLTPSNAFTSAFGLSVAYFADATGDRIAVGAPADASGGTGVGSDAAAQSAPQAGAAYVYRRDASGAWLEEAYIKPPYIGNGGFTFGHAVALAKGTLAVGAHRESSADGMGSPPDYSPCFGAVYTFTLATGAWSVGSIVKPASQSALPSSPCFPDNGSAARGLRFGETVALSSDGNTLAVGASGDTSSASGVNGDAASSSDPNATSVGAVWIFTRTDANAAWSPQAYLKPDDPGVIPIFGGAVALSADGNALAVGASGFDEPIPSEKGGVYAFARTGGTWIESARFTATSPNGPPALGVSVAITRDGTLIAAGAPEDSCGTAGVNPDPAQGVALSSGAVHLYRADGGAWREIAFVKASNPENSARFGASVAVTNGTLAVGAPEERSLSVGVNGSQSSTAINARPGAAYAY